MTGSLPEIGRENWQQSASPLVDPAQWTAVIPAAGRGSRLGFDRPKILYPVAGRPILDWLRDLVSPFCSRLVIVASPSGAEYLDDCVIQQQPLGMADAIEAALPRLDTTHALII